CAECAPAARSQYRPPSSAGSACAWTIAFRGNGLREPGARQVLPSSQPGARSQPLEPPSFPEKTQSHSLALRPSWFLSCWYARACLVSGSIKQELSSRPQAARGAPLRWLFLRAWEHPHMLRHACGFKLANDGHDTRALQHYLGHKNIQHTVRYTEMAPDRFKDFWRN